MRATVKRRDRKVCQYCGHHAPDGEPDHVLLLARGGADRLTNLVWACKECNRSKSDRTLREWLDALHETPVDLPEFDIRPRQLAGRRDIIV